MAVDNWIISDGTRDYLDVTVTIADVPYPRRIAISQISAGTQAETLVKLRSILNEFRNAVISQNTVPSAVQNVIGYTEDF